MEDESLTLDPGVDYHSINELSHEIKERLTRVRPTSIVCPLSITIFVVILIHCAQGAAKRMEGMTPNAIVGLLRFVRKRESARIIPLSM